jgi:hypothetical protein
MSRCLVQMLRRQAELTQNYSLLLQAASDSATVDSVGVGELIHGMAGKILLSDLSRLGSSETTLHLT